MNLNLVSSDIWVDLSQENFKLAFCCEISGTIMATFSKKDKEDLDKNKEDEQIHRKN